jgi:hypothetical protein
MLVALSTCAHILPQIEESFLVGLIPSQVASIKIRETTHGPLLRQVVVYAMVVL